MEVVSAELQNSVVFQVSEVLGFTTLNGSKVPGIKMRWVQGDGLYVQTPKLTARTRIGFVPAANVKCVEFLQEDFKETKPKIKAV